VRDVGGVRQRAINDWGYNAWGDKYPPYDLDDVIPTRIAEEMNEVLFQPGIVMEGGSLDVNGRGTLVTTESCLLNPNRNPHLNREQIERYLKDYLGVTNILWLGDGIAGDDTDGHVDDLTRFVSPDTVVTAIEDDPADENYEPLVENYERLTRMKDQDGKPLRVVKLPMPGPVYFGDQRLPASYANFYIANKSVLVPTYRHANDAKACEIMRPPPNPPPRPRGGAPVPWAPGPPPPGRVFRRPLSRARNRNPIYIFRLRLYGNESSNR
jgi:agmatine deiminase